MWRNYGYDGRGRIQQEDRKYGSLTKSRVFGYTPQGELERVEQSTTAASVSCPEPSEGQDVNDGTNCVPSAERTVQTDYRFQYDSAGNLRRQEDLVTSAVVLGTHPTANRIGSWGSVTYDHDADGNRRTRTGSGVTTTYTWSADGRLLSVASGATTLGYDYDAFGQLIRRTRSGVAERYYLWDGGHLMAELTGTATQRVAEYVYGPGMDNPVAIVTGPTAIAATRYFEEDDLGNVIGVFGSTVAQTLRYDARGNVEETTGALADTNRLRWKGLVWEGDVTQLYYVRNRWYDAETGRFMSEDPIGLTGGLNLYAFAGNDPINGIDPLGLCPVDGGRTVGDGVIGQDPGGNRYRCVNGAWVRIEDFHRHTPITTTANGSAYRGSSVPGSRGTTTVSNPGFGGPTGSRDAALYKGLQCAGSAIALSANLVMSGFVLVGLAEMAAGVIAGEGLLFTAGVLGTEANLAAAGAIILRGAHHFARGAFPSKLTGIAVGGDIAGDNFSWVQSFLPVVGLPSAFRAVGRNCGGW